VQQCLHLDHFLFRMIANLLVANELQLGIFEIEFVHHVDCVGEVSADTVADNSQFQIARLLLSGATRRP